MNNRFSIQKAVCNAPITVSTLAVVCLCYTGKNDFVMGILSVLWTQLLLVSCMRGTLWLKWRKRIRIPELVLGGLLAYFFAKRFYWSMAENGIMELMALLTGLNRELCNAAMAAVGGIAAVPCFAGVFGRIGDQLTCLRTETLAPAVSFEMTKQIKGFMIIFMVILHAFSCPSFYIESISYPDMEPFVNIINRGANICVGVFAFFNGYFYGYHKDRSVRYSLKKICAFGYKYWVVLVLFLLVAVMFCGYRPGLGDIIWEALTLSRSVILFNWYVHFYVIVMLVLPFVVRIGEKCRSPFAELLGFVLVWCTMVLINRVFTSSQKITMVMGTQIEYFPGVAVGYFVAKYRLIDRGVEKIKKNIPPVLTAFLGVALIVIVLYLRFKLFRIRVLGEKIQTDSYLAPLFVLGFALLPLCRCKVLKALLDGLGNYAVEIWFIHALFFADATKYVFQPVAYWPKHPVLVVCWILTLSYALALVVVRCYPIPKKWLLKIKRKWALKQNKMEE